MRCPYCGYEVEYGNGVCKVCGRNLRVYKRIMDSSAVCYNMGLKKAQIRDLSGAISMLKQSLKYNKYNIDARNLLGLVYFEIGESANALYEWVISKNLKPYDNEADYYLEKMSGNSGMLNRADSTTKKFNQALASARQGDLDLAAISLKRIVSENPKMVKAKTLLALLSIEGGNYRLARKNLIEALKIDANNEEATLYLQELKALTAQKKSGSKRNRNDEIENDIASDIVKEKYVEEGSHFGIVNILIGAIIGVLASVFLVFPALRQHSNEDALKAFLTANEDIRSTENEISSKQEQIDALTEVLSMYEGKADIKQSYEFLIQSQNALNAGDYDNAIVFFESITESVLDPQGKAEYDALASVLVPHKTMVTYEASKKKMEDKDIDGAIEGFLTVLAFDEGYDNGNALYNIGLCYEEKGSIEDAVRSYHRIEALFERRNIAYRAQARLREIE